MTTPKLNVSSDEWNELMNTTFGNGGTVTTKAISDQMYEAIRRNPRYDPWLGVDPAADARYKREQYERERLEGMVGDMVRRRVRAELDRMNSTRTAMVQLEVCAEGGFTVVHNGNKYACADTQAMTERIVAITAVMALEQLDKEKS